MFFETHLSLVFLIELFSDSSYLSTFELGDLDRAPALGGANERAEHQIQDGVLAKGIGDDFEAATLLHEQAFKQIRGADRSAVCDGESQVRNAGFEVVHEARHASFLLSAVVRYQPGSELGAMARLGAW